MQRRVTLGIVAGFNCLRADRFSGIFSGDMDAPQFHHFADADVDKFIIRRMSIGQLRNLCGHVCDLANRNPYLREPYFDDKLCIISSPVAVYIPVASRGVFVQSLMEHFNNSNRFLAPSEQSNRLLVSSHPLKMLTSTVQSALQVADIRVVDVMCFGMKAIPPLFGFLDKIMTAPQLELWAVPNYAPEIVMDVGFSVERTGVPVVRMPRHARLAAGKSKTYPVCQYYQNVHWRDDVDDQTMFGSYVWNSASVDADLLKVRVYGALIHCIKDSPTWQHVKLSKYIPESSARYSPTWQLHCQKTPYFIRMSDVK